MSRNQFQKKAFGYIRVSGQGQIQGDGFKRQEETISGYAKKYGYEIEDFYKEEGVSGTTEEIDRPAFQRMVTAILKNGVDTVIVEGLDRLAREYRIQETLLIYLASKGIRLISARTEEDVTQAIEQDPMKKALIQIQGVFSELEKNMLVKKLRIARNRKKAETGKCEGRKSLKEVDPELLKEIKRLRRKRPGQKRMSYQKVADKLNEQGFRTMTGKEFTRANVFRICSSF